MTEASTMPSGPMRTCIGCRAASPASELVCLIAPAGQLRLARRGPGRAGQAADEAGGRGRGAWTHPRCLGAALERGPLGRAFRRPVEVLDREALVGAIHESPAGAIHESPAGAIHESSHPRAHSARGRTTDVQGN